MLKQVCCVSRLGAGWGGDWFPVDPTVQVHPSLWVSRDCGCVPESFSEPQFILCWGSLCSSCGTSELTLALHSGTPCREALRCWGSVLEGGSTLPAVLSALAVSHLFLLPVPLRRSLNTSQPVPPFLEPQQPAQLPADAQPQRWPLLHLRAHWGP